MSLSGDIATNSSKLHRFVISSFFQFLREQTQTHTDADENNTLRRRFTDG